jgi:hypothetical protein
MLMGICRSLQKGRSRAEETQRAFVQLTWSFIMGMSTEETQGHVEGNTALL